MKSKLFHPCLSCNFKRFFSFFFGFLILVIFNFFTSCAQSQIEKKLTLREKNIRIDAKNVHQWAQDIKFTKSCAVENYIDSLSLEEQISQLFILNLDGNEKFKVYENLSSVNPEVAQDKPLVAGGYLFFSYNLQSEPQKIMEFTADIRNKSIFDSNIPPFLAVDQEGGLVNRLRGITNYLPSPQKVSESYDLSGAGELYYLQGIQMKALGFDMNLAPVVEPVDDYNRDFLSGRSFGDAENTASYSSVFVDSFKKAGISSVIKHFPGNTNTDPHTGLPEITLSEQQMRAALEPFAKVASKAPAGVLMSHARTSIIDSDIPSCFSKRWVTEILREKIGFEGIIFSDDIFMGALANNGYPPDVACIKALEAGVDCIMISEKKFARSAKVLFEKACADEVFAKRVRESCKRIVLYKLDAGILSLDETSPSVYEVRPLSVSVDFSARISDFESAKRN